MKNGRNGAWGIEKRERREAKLALIEARRRREADRESRLFIAAAAGTETYQRVCGEVAAERARDRAVI